MFELSIIGVLSIIFIIVLFSIQSVFHIFVLLLNTALHSFSSYSIVLSKGNDSLCSQTSICPEFGRCMNFVCILFINSIFLLVYSSHARSKLMIAAHEVWMFGLL